MVGVRRASNFGAFARNFSAAAFLGAGNGVVRRRSTGCFSSFCRAAGGEIRAMVSCRTPCRPPDGRRAPFAGRVSSVVGTAQGLDCRDAGHGRHDRPRLCACTDSLSMKIDYRLVEEAAKELYLRALKVLPPDVKEGFTRLAAQETTPIAQRVLATMIKNISVAEDTDNLLCQDTGVPIYNVSIGTNVDIDGIALKRAIRDGCARATVEHPLRSSIVHPLTRKNDQTSCGVEVPVIHV